MALRSISVGEAAYHLIAFDKQGQERQQPDGTLDSRTVIDRVASGDITDVFVLSHGWMGDTPAAVQQYDTWVTRMATQAADVAAFRDQCADFRPLVVGLHWPSLPWGDERMPDASRDGGLLGDDDGAGEFTGQDRPDLDHLVELYADRTADTAPARAALRAILAADPRSGPPTLGSNVEEAYQVLFGETALGTGTIAGPPGDDQEGFDPTVIIDEAAAAALAAAFETSGLLGAEQRQTTLELLRMPLRQLSFWTMKKRGRLFGESGAHRLVTSLQEASPTVRVHLMGHSFGCLVVTGAVAGPTVGPPLTRPVQTLYLVQGAMSLWSFADHIPREPGAVGYFHRVLADGMVEGPIVTTRSSHDTAVAVFYPRGAQLTGQLLLGEEYPAYGGLGTFGARGVSQAEDRPIQPATEPYFFRQSAVCNLEASNVIAHGSGPSGAHCDLDHDELAHAFWQAALASVP